MDSLLAARSQMGMAHAFHIVSSPLGISLPLMTTISEGAVESTADPIY
jgi:cytochrome bd-type quinol oxidase subunit 1